MSSVIADPIAFIPQTGFQTRKKPIRKDVTADEVVESYRAGNKGPAIAAVLGTSTNTVYRRLRSAGVTAQTSRHKTSTCKYCGATINHGQYCCSAHQVLGRAMAKNQKHCDGTPEESHQNNWDFKVIHPIIQKCQDVVEKSPFIRIDKILAAIDEENPEEFITAPRSHKRMEILITRSMRLLGYDRIRKSKVYRRRSTPS